MLLDALDHFTEKLNILTESHSFKNDFLLMHVFMKLSKCTHLIVHGGQSSQWKSSPLVLRLALSILRCADVAY